MAPTSKFLLVRKGTGLYSERPLRGNKCLEVLEKSEGGIGVGGKGGGSAEMATPRGKSGFKMSAESTCDFDTEECVSIPSLPTVTLTPSIERHAAFLSPVLPSEKLLPPLHFLTPRGTHSHLGAVGSEPAPLTRPAEPLELMEGETDAAAAFDLDFDQHCRRIAPEGESTLTYSQLSELLTDMHLLNPLSSQHKPLLAQFWQVLVKPEAALINREDVKRMLKAILCITPEKRSLWTTVLRHFQSFTTNRLRYLNLQVHAMSAAQEATAQTRAEAVRQSPAKSPHKTNRPMLPLGRSPTELLKSKTASPLRIPETRKLLATVKVNLSPQKFDVINVYRGDSVKDLAERFIEKHGLAGAMVEKLRAMMESKLQSRSNSLD